MKKCANVCETYLQRSTVAKVFMGSVAAKEITEWIGTFTRRRADFQISMNVYLVQQSDAIRADTMYLRRQ